VNILGIETSSDVCSVGIVNDRGLNVERNIIDPHIHSEKLLTLVEEVLQQAEISLKDLDSVAVSIGPGSFTGLRIGLSSAKGLCYSLDKRLIAVSTFDAIAFAAHESRPKFTSFNVVVDAKQGEFYYGTMNTDSHQRSPMMKAQTVRLEEICWSVTSGDAVLWITDRPDVIEQEGIASGLICDYSRFCKGDAVAHEAIGKYNRNEFADLASVEPMYLKEFLVKTATT